MSAAASNPTGLAAPLSATAGAPDPASSLVPDAGGVPAPIKLASPAFVPLSSPLLVPAFTCSPDKPERSPLILPKSSALTTGKVLLLELGEVIGSLSLVIAGALE